jgi:hypothetical protein
MIDTLLILVAGFAGADIMATLLHGAPSWIVALLVPGGSVLGAAVGCLLIAYDDGMIS